MMETPPVSPVDLLLVEPDATLAAFYLEALREAGYSVERAASPVEALALCAARGAEAFRVALSPAFSAAPTCPYTWLERLRARTNAAIVIRAAAPEARFGDYQRRGYAGVLAEPCAVDDMINVVAAIHAGQDMARRQEAEAAGAATPPDVDAVSGAEMDPYEMGYLRARAALDQLDAALAAAGARDERRAETGLILEALRGGALILCPPGCPREGCAVALFDVDGRDHLRCCYGAERGVLAEIGAGARAGFSCPHCGVLPGQWHHVGCLFEMCPLCGEALLEGCAGHAPARCEPLMPGSRPAGRRPSLTPRQVVSVLRLFSGALTRVQGRTGLNLRPVVLRLLQASDLTQLRGMLAQVEDGELAALRALYRSSHTPLCVSARPRCPGVELGA